MRGKFTLIIYFIIISLLVTFGDAICSEKQKEPEKTIVFGTIVTESISFLMKCL